MRSSLVGPFDLSVAAGECIAISGASGSGKSLFLRMVADLDPNTGAVFLDGRERGSFAAPAWRRQVIYVPAESGWWSEAVADHFSDLAAARVLAARLDLKPELLDGPVLRLSTGEKQRLALVRSLLPASPVLLLDEPTAALDETSQGHAEALLRERLQAGTAILMVTHRSDQAARLSRRRFVMAQGRLTPA
ncbi:ABC transporter ATP-binding protein [Limobrevibacterium gyesilva]|nr:ABC transporter ATP-binding protein [Limobrevibacterium gyesilva]